MNKPLIDVDQIRKLRTEGNYFEATELIRKYHADAEKQKSLLKLKLASERSKENQVMFREYYRIYQRYASSLRTLSKQVKALEEYHKKEESMSDS